MPFFLKNKLKWAMALKGRRVGRDHANKSEGIKIGSSISKSNNDGKIDKDFQAWVINAISSTLSDQIYILLGQEMEKASTFQAKGSKYPIT